MSLNKFIIFEGSWRGWGIESRISWSAAASSDAVNSRTLHRVTWRSQLSVHLYQKYYLVSGSAVGLVLVRHWMTGETHWHGWHGEHDGYRFNNINSCLHKTQCWLALLSVFSEMILMLLHSALSSSSTMLKFKLVI